ncbi:MAG: SRPBCC family protein [Acidimicrobiia bacterium]|nr:SRPBCC family protein [Acidimicrobiia bacterium]
MPTVEESIVISASRSAVSDVLLDIDAAPQWTSSLENLELIEGKVGEAGCVGYAHYVEGSRRYIVEDRLVEAVPGDHFKSELRGGGLKATVETRLDETPSGTRVTIRWKGSGTNPVTGTILPFLRRQVAKRMREDMQALRNLVEDQVTQDRRPHIAAIASTSMTA